MAASAPVALVLDARRHRYDPTALHEYLAEARGQLQWSREQRWRKGDRDARHRVDRFYKKHAPNNLPSVRRIVDVYGEDEVDELMETLVEEYGEEPGDDEPLIACPPHLCDDDGGDGTRAPRRPRKERDTAPRCRYGFLVDEPDAHDIWVAVERVWAAPTRADIHAQLRQQYHAFDVGDNVQRLAWFNSDSVAKHSLPDDVRRRIYIDFAYAKFGSDIGRYHHNLTTAMLQSTKDTKAIKKDMLRTFPTNSRFEEDGDLFVPLHNVLTAASHAVKGGYCQSMNFIAGVLLIITENEAVSYAYLKHIVDDVAYNKGYYDERLSNCVLDQGVLKRRLRMGMFPAVRRLMELGMNAEDFAVRWFLCIFIDAIPFRSMLHFWDCYVTRGISFLFQFTLALLGSFDKVESIRTAHDFAEATMAVNKYVATLTDIAPIVAHALQVPFTQADLVKERAAVAANSEAERHAAQTPPPEDTSPATNAKKRVGRLFGRK